MEDESKPLIEAWIKLQEMTDKLGEDSPEVQNLRWAHIDLDDACTRAAMRALAAIRRILDSTTNESVLSILAAGPLEDVLARNGPEIIVDVETSARQDPRFRWLLRGVLRNAIDDDVWKRVQQAAMP
jgi:hypothetical protein